MAVPEGLDSGALVKQVKARFGAIIANGQGEMQGKIFRIAHLGYFDYMDTIALIGALELVARDTLKLPVTLGQGLAAAQEVFAARKENEALNRACLCGRDVCCRG